MERLTGLSEANRSYVESGRHRDVGVRPVRALTVITCMDARIDVFEALGLRIGDAHVLRNAGGRVTEDVLRSLTLSTHLLGTRAVAVVAHTDCGLRDPDDDLVERLTDEMGHAPTARDWRTFTDPQAAVSDDCEHLLAWADQPDGLVVAGYVLDVTDGRLREIVPPTSATEP